MLAPTDFPGGGKEGSELTVEFTVTGFTLVPTSVPVAEAGKHPEANRPGEGHLHFVLDLQPLVVWERDEPYTFTNIPPGEHLLMIELTNNDHSPLSPPITQQIQFRSEAPQELPVAGSGTAPLLDGGSALLVLGVLLVAGGLIVRRRHGV